VLTQHTFDPSEHVRNPGHLQNKAVYQLTVEKVNSNYMVTLALRKTLNYIQVIFTISF